LSDCLNFSDKDSTFLGSTALAYCEAGKNWAQVDYRGKQTLDNLAKKGFPRLRKVILFKQADCKEAKLPRGGILKGFRDFSTIKL